MEQMLQELKSQPVEDIIKATFRLIDGFAKGAPQHDDITAMALRYEGK
jgi:serine phosphatase RsbU (regulator of sigma subunit)